MWWLTLACLLLAIVLVWISLPETGVQISVQFPEGHGLQAEDQVLFRGIEVGYVDDVKLNSDLTSVDVSITLNSSAADLAIEGTRFWIVRPQLSLSRITGLETAVGHKYVSLEPGQPNGKRQYFFDGLVEPPPKDAGSPGLEIVVRGDKRYSVSPGSTVSFRGVVVGRILTVGLSQDSRYVDIRAKIFEKYRPVLTTTSRFWASSGINFDFSLSEGLKFDSESLASIAQGGISFLTISNDGEPIQNGHVFRLSARPEEEWLTAADSVSSTNIKLGGVVKLNKRWQQKGLLGRRTRSTSINAIPVQGQNGSQTMLIPKTGLAYPEKAIEGSQEITMFATDGEQQVVAIDRLAPDSNDDAELAQLEWPNEGDVNWLGPQSFRVPEKPESVLAVRANVEDTDVTYLHYPIEGTYIREDWILPQFDGDAELWNGAPVLSSADGKIIGVLIVDIHQARILTFEPTRFGF